MKFNPTNYPTIVPSSSDLLLVRRSSDGAVRTASVENVANAQAITSAENIVALKAIDTDIIRDGTSALVLGYYSTGDNGGGAFYYDASSAVAANDGTIIAPNSGVGRWFRQYAGAINPIWFGCKGDGTTDDTVRLQACLDAGSGASVDMLSGYTFAISDQLDVPNGTRIYGKSGIFALANTNIVAMLSGTSVDSVSIEDVELDANADNNGSNYGISLGGGSGNSVINVFVHDTIQAGARIFSESNTRVIGGRYVNCGRNGLTDNHGIMIYSITTTPVKGILVDGAQVINAYRKGITTYNFGSGVVDGVQIVSTYTEGCGLGGVYCATAPGANPQLGIMVSGNTGNGNYVNFTVSNAEGAICSDNISRSADHFGYNFDIFTGLTAVGNSDEDSGIHGFAVFSTSGTSSELNLSSNVVLRPNRTTAGFGAGITLDNILRSVVSDNIVFDDSGGALMTHGIYEEATCDYNQIMDNMVFNATSALIVRNGTNTALRNLVGIQQGFNLVTPLNTVDINGGLSLRSQAITFANGANNNVALPALAGTLISTGPSGVYNITGVAGGTDGKIITIMNYTAFTMTITHNSGSSSAGNKILIGGSADLAVAQYGSVTLQWTTQTNAWIVIGYKA